MRFRFTIRDLLWLTVVVAVATGWWLEHKRSTPEWPDIGGVGIITPFAPMDKCWPEPDETISKEPK